MESRSDMEIRRAQIEQLEEMKPDNLEKKKKKFGVLDVTRVIVMGPDGHPNFYRWGNLWMKGFNNDCTVCTHRCLPGPVDA